MHSYVHCSVIYNHQDLEAAQVPISTWVDNKLWYIYTVEHYLAVKKEGNLTFCGHMDRPGEYYAKWNKPVGERQIPYDFTCGEPQKPEFICKKLCIYSHI